MSYISFFRAGQRDLSVRKHYSSVDCISANAVALAMESASGIDPWSPLPRVRALSR